MQTYHETFKNFGEKSLHVLDYHMKTPRYLGFSEFLSSNALRNSSYGWTIGKDKRIKDKAYKKYNDNIYNLPDLKSSRYTIPGYGQRKDMRPVIEKNNPGPNRYFLESLFDYNLKHRKGSSLGAKLSYQTRNEKFIPGPGTYNSINLKKMGIIPILIKSRQGFFYDDDLKKKKATVSMQKYRPNFTLVERNRFHAITFGIGDRPKMHSLNNFPGPGSYNIPGNFDKGLKKKLALN